MDQVDNLILQVQGRDKVAALNDELAKEAKALEKLAADLRTGAVAQAAFDQAARQSAGEVMRLEAEIKKLAGSGIGLSGGGVLQASYAVQDFTSVLAGGQGLGRALSSVQNNIPGFLMSMGASGGVAGIVSLASLAVGAFIPLIEKMWGAFDDKEAVERAKERLRELQAQIKETHKAFVALQQAPTDVERLSAEGIGLFLRERPNADKAAAAVAAGVTDTEARGALTPGEQVMLGKSGDSADRTDRDLEIEAGQAARAEHAALGGEGPVPAAVVEGHRQGLAAERDAARKERTRLMQLGRTRRGESVVTGATVAGPAGAAAREELLRKALGVKGLEELAEYDPARIERAEREYEEGLPEFEGIAEGGRALSRAMRRRRGRAKQQAQARARLHGAQTDAVLGRHADEIKQQQHDEAAEERAQAQDEAKNLAGYERSKKTAPFRRARAGVQQMLQSEGIPASPDAIDQLANQTLRNMDSGLNQQQATFSAIMGKMQAMNEAMARWQQTQAQYQAESQRLNMGAGQSGLHSLLPPMW